MGIKLLLLSPEGDVREAYHNKIGKLDVQFDTVASFKELYDAMAHNPYNGVMVDLNAKLRAPREETVLAMDILERFPVAELRWDIKEKKIGIYYQGQHKDGGNIEDFVNRICQTFYARKIGLEKRERIHFNVLLAKENDFSEGNVEHTVTIDISKGGCFIFSNNNWKDNDNAWFIIKELSDQTPILGEVCWKVEWGKSMRIPGIGLRYKEIKENQLDEICNTKPRKERMP